MDEKIYTKDELKSIIDPLLERFGMASASLFGSYGRGEATSRSDIDVLLVMDEDSELFNVFGVAEGLHRATGKAVDVYEISELLPGEFRNTVLAEAVPL